MAEKPTSTTVSSTEVSGTPVKTQAFVPASEPFTFSAPPAFPPGWAKHLPQFGSEAGKGTVSELKAQQEDVDYDVEGDVADPPRVAPPKLWPTGPKAEAKAAEKPAPAPKKTKEKTEQVKTSVNKEKPKETGSGGNERKKVDKPCRDFAAGNCRRGDKCMFRHDPPPAQPPPPPPVRNDVVVPGGNDGGDGGAPPPPTGGAPPPPPPPDPLPEPPVPEPFAHRDDFHKGSLKRSVEEVVAAWVRGYKVTLNQEDVKPVCAAMGWSHEAQPAHAPFRIVRQSAEGMHPHKVQAVCRQLVTVYCIAQFVRSGHLSIDSVFGNDRDQEFIQPLRDELVWWGHAGPTLYVVGDQIVPEDATRRTRAPVVVRQSSVGFLVDVYACGGTLDNPVEFTREWAAKSGYDELLWAGHVFDGPYGTFAESAWYRDSRGWINWRADPVNWRPYRVHPPCDLIHCPQAGDGVVVTSKRAFHIMWQGERKLSYNVMLVKPSSMQADPIPPASAAVMTVEVPDMFLLFQRWFGQYWEFVPSVILDALAYVVLRVCPRVVSRGLCYRKISVFKKHYWKISDFLSSKARTGFSWKSALRESAQIVASDMDFCKCRDFADAQLQTYVIDLTSAAYYGNCEYNSNTAATLAAHYNDSFSRFNTSVNAFGVKEEASGQVIPKVLLAVAAVSFVAIMTRKVGFAQCDVRDNLRVLKQKILDVCMRVKQISLQGTVGTWSAIKSGACWFGSRLKEAVRTASSWVKADVLKVQEARTLMAREYDTSRSQELFIKVTKQLTEMLKLVFIYPLLEEGFKRVLGVWWWRVLASVMLGCGDVHSTANKGRPVSVLYQTVLHCWWAFLPAWLGVAWHGAHNLIVLTYRGLIHGAFAAVGGPWSIILMVVTAMFSICKFFETVKQERNMWDEFVEEHYSGVKSVVCPDDDRNEICSLRDDQLIVPRVDAFPVKEPEADLTVSVTATGLPSEAVATATPGYYQILGHNAPLYAPANSVWNAALLVPYRLAKATIDYTPETKWRLTLLWRSTFLSIFERNMLLMHGWRAHGCPEPLALLGAGHKCFDADAWDFVKLPVHGSHGNFGLISLDPDLEIWDREPLYTSGWVQFEPAAAFQAWLVHTEPSKRPRYLAAFEKVSAMPLTARHAFTTKCQVNPKCDEVLLKYALRWEDNGWVPRPIHSVAPELAVTLGPWVYFLTDLLKASLNMAIVGGTSELPVTWTYGSGTTADQLTLWFGKACATQGVHVITAGDDFLIVVRNGDALGFVEGDISQCDHSLRSQALCVQWRLLHLLGMPLDTLELLVASSRSLCVINKKKQSPDGMMEGVSTDLFIALRRESERNTGGVDTTFGNTVCIGLAVVGVCQHLAHTIDRLFDKTLVAELFLERYGLTVKLEPQAGRFADLGGSFYPPTFLKGTWWPTDDADHPWKWGPLLSRLLKLFKTMSDPRRTFKHIPASVNLRYALHCQMVAVAKGLRPFTFPKPIKDWFATWEQDPQSSRIEAKVEDLHAPWKVQAGVDPGVVRDEWIEQACARYGVDGDVIRSFVTRLLTLREGQCFFHPLWLKMALRDYN